MSNIKKLQLVTVSRYAELWQMDRTSVYARINDGRLQVYETPRGNRFLNPHENPNLVKK